MEEREHFHDIIKKNNLDQTSVEIEPSNLKNKSKLENIKKTRYRLPILTFTIENCDLAFCEAFKFKKSWV